MGMTSREIVDRAIHFRRPERIGMTLPSPYPNDVAFATVQPEPGFKGRSWSEGHAEFWTDEWGNTWSRLNGLTGGEVVKGAIEEWDQFDHYVMPDLGADARYEKAREVVRDNPDAYLFVGLRAGWFFSAARYIRRMENYLCDLLAEPQRVRRLNDMVIAENEKIIRRAAALGCQAVMTWEDWGMQSQPLVSPQMFREQFKPGIAHLCGLAKDLGLARWMHSCGGMTKLMPDLIEAGVQVFQFDSPNMHGIDYLNDHFGGRVAFWCPVDIQKTLQTRDPVKIRAEARELCEKLGGHQGGFIAGYYGDNRSIGLDPSVQDIACRAFVEFGSPKGQGPPVGPGQPRK
jgi:hypothetical protein